MAAAVPARNRARRRAVVGVTLCGLLLAAGCSTADDAGTGQASGNPSAQLSAPAAHASAAPTPSTVSAPSQAAATEIVSLPPNAWATTPAVGATVTGKDYSFVLPGTWADITERANQPKANFDTAVQDASDTDGFASYFTVMSTGAAGIVGQTGASEFMKEELQNSGASQVATLPSGSLDGEPVLRQKGQMSQKTASGTLVYHVEQWIVSHGEDTFIISFAANKGTSDAQMAKTFGPVVSSWQWK